MFDEPITFKEADEMIRNRMDQATAMKYKDILAGWSQDARQRAFFSARVADATLLSEIHRRVSAVVNGSMTSKQAVRLLRESFAGPNADALAALGFAPKANAQGVAELASIPRLRLIVEQNTRMAQECGHYQQWEAVKDYYPIGVWHCGHAEVHRPEHLARDGRAYEFGHPIWTQSPPGGEFNCHCWRENLTREAAAARGLVPESNDSFFQPSSLGFDPSMPLDKDSVQPGKRVLPQFVQQARDAKCPDNVLEDMEVDAVNAEQSNALNEKFQREIEETNSYLELSKGEYKASFDEAAEGAAESEFKDMEEILQYPVEDAKREELMRAWAVEDDEYSLKLSRAIKENEDKKAKINDRIDLIEERNIKLLEKRNRSGLTAVEDKELRGIVQCLNAMYNQSDELNRRLGKDMFRRNVLDAAVSNDNVSGIALDLAIQHPQLTPELAKIASRHELTLNARRIAGAINSAWMDGFDRLGNRPSIFFDKMPPDNPNAIQGAYYYMDAIHLDRRFGKWNSNKMTAIHEMGHWFDYHTRGKGYFVDKDNFVSLGESDVKKLLEGLTDNQIKAKFGTRHNGQGTYWWNELPKKLFGHVNDLSQNEKYIITSYADTLQSVTRGDYGWGHPVDYASNPMNYGVEAFAETFLAVIRKDKEFAACYPKQYGYIKDTIRKVKKGKIK